MFSKKIFTVYCKHNIKKNSRTQAGATYAYGNHCVILKHNFQEVQTSFRTKAVPVPVKRDFN